MTHPIRAQSIRSNMTYRLRVGAWVHASCFVALYCGRALAQEQQGPPVEEVDVSTERQNALENEALTISLTPNAGPHLPHTTAVLALGAVTHPVYPGSNKNRVDLFPYFDIRGLLGDRVFVSDAGGLGVKILNDGLVRAGISVGYGGGRKSSDDPHLKGLPDVKRAARVTSYIALALKPFALQATVQNRLGSERATTASFGASYNVAPLPQLHLTLGAGINWADASYQKLYSGITPADAATATAQGNPLPPYAPGSGLTTAVLSTTVVYQISRHWGVIGLVTLNDLVGSPISESPLTQRTYAAGFALGMAYSF